MEKPEGKRQVFKNDSGTAGIMGFGQRRRFSSLAGRGSQWGGGKVDLRVKEGSILGDANSLGKLGGFECESRKWSNYLSEEQIHSPHETKMSILLQTWCQQLKKVNATQGGKQKKKRAPRSRRIRFLIF